MKYKTKIIFKFLIIFMSMKLISCSSEPSQEKLRNLENLKLKIAEGIHVPFQSSNSDTITWFCVDTSFEEVKGLDSIFELTLCMDPYIEMVKKKCRQVILFIDAFTLDSLSKAHLIALHNYVDSTENSIDSYPNDPYSFFNNKISARVAGKMISNESVEITESYVLKDSSYIITKLFILKNGEWAETNKVVKKISNSVKKDKKKLKHKEAEKKLLEGSYK